MKPEKIQDITEILSTQSYLADKGLATALFLALKLGRPLLLEGEAGVGKTEVAKALASALDRELVRLQCYEGIDANQALYEWDYTRQLLYVRALSGEDAATEHALDELFGRRFLVERPLLKALQLGDRAVLLIDEIDRADDEFEAFLLEVLSDFQVSVPEIGTIKADQPPIVIVTSNRTRELHDALKRRCLYHWIDLPSIEREVEIMRVRAPEVSEKLARSIASAVSKVRNLDLIKRPGIAETIDWALAASALGVDGLNEEVAAQTLGAVVKEHDDLVRVRSSLSEVVDE